MSKLISNILTELENKKISQARLAEMAGLPQKSVNNLLAGRTKRLDMEVIGKLNAALNIVSEPDTAYGVSTIHRALTPDQEAMLEALEGNQLAQLFIKDMIQLEGADLAQAYADFVKNWKGKK